MQNSQNVSINVNLLNKMAQNAHVWSPWGERSQPSQNGERHRCLHHFPLHSSAKEEEGKNNGGNLFLKMDLVHNEDIYMRPFLGSSLCVQSLPAIVYFTRGWLEMMNHTTNGPYPPIYWNSSSSISLFRILDDMHGLACINSVYGTWN